MYQGCILAYGLHKEGNTQPKKLKNAETGSLRREKRKICNLINFLAYSIRIKDWDKDRIMKLAIKADYHAIVKENEIKDTMGKLKKLRRIKQNEITVINRHF